MIEKGWPPNSTEEDRKLTNVITTYRGKIYLCNQENVRDDLIVHEKIHLKQQGDDYDSWLKRYQTDKAFQIDQEVEAYRGQLSHIRKTLGDSKANTATLAFSKFLSSKVYGNIISYEEALKKLSCQVTKV